MSQFDGTLDPAPNLNVKFDKEDKTVVTILKLIERNFSDKKEQDDKNERVVDEAEAPFHADVPEGTRKLQSLKMKQAHWTTMSRMKPLDYSLHGVDAPRPNELLVEAGVNTVLKKGGFFRGLMSKGGALGTASAIGDGFLLMGTKKKGFPFTFLPVPNTNVYTDVQATHLRLGSRPARKVAVIIPRTIAEFNKLYPDHAQKVGAGKIPRDYDAFKGLTQTDLQKLDEDEKEIIEELRFYDLDNEVYSIIAGKGCTKILEKKGEDYPFTFHDRETDEEEQYIPLLHFIGDPSFKGFYNHGIYHWLYAPSVLSRQTFNKVASGVSDNLDPIQVMSVPKKQGSQIFEQVTQAAAARANGKKPMVVLEYDPASPGASGISQSSLLSNVDVAAAEYIDNKIDREVTRMGMHLDTISNPINELHILSEEENSNMWVRQMLENNAPEFEFLLRVVLDQIPRLVKPDEVKPMLAEDGTPILDDKGQPRFEIKQGDKTPVYLTTKLRLKNGIKDARFTTLGAVANELLERPYFERVNSRSGAIAPRMRLSQLRQGLALAQPGSKADVEIKSQIAQARDLDLAGEDFLVQQAPAPTDGAENVKPIPTETERQIGEEQTVF